MTSTTIPPQRLQITDANSNKIEIHKSTTSQQSCNSDTNLENQTHKRLTKHREITIKNAYKTLMNSLGCSRSKRSVKFYLQIYIFIHILD